MDSSSNRGIAINGNQVTFHNLVSSDTQNDNREVISVELQQASPVVSRSNAAGTLREIDRLGEVATLGAEAAAEFMHIINSKA